MRFPARLPTALAAVVLALSLGPGSGCARSRTFTIYSKPADARLIINGVDRGQGPITQRFDFGGSSGAVRVTAVREGYQPRTQRLTANTPRDTVVIELDSAGPKAVVSVEPPAMLRVNGTLVSPTPVRQHEIPLDAADPDRVYTVTAEQTGYVRETRTITSKDPQGYYRIALKPVSPVENGLAQATRPPEQRGSTQPSTPTPAPAPTAAATRPTTRETPLVQADPPRTPPPQPPAQTAPAPLRRDIIIRTEPAVPGAEIYIAGEKWGDREVRLLEHEFKRDAAGRPLAQPIAAVAPGFEGGQATMRWEDNKPLYVIPLGRRRKEVRIATDPPGGTVSLNGKTLPKDRVGVSYDTLYFPPQDPPQQPTTLTAAVAPADPGAYEPAQLPIRWDDGRRDYTVKLELSRFVKVSTVQVVPTWDERSGWRAVGNRADTTAARDVSEGPGRPTPQPLAELPPGTMLDSVIASPDGTIVLYTEMIQPPGGGGASPLRSQLRLLNSDGTPGPSLPSDGRHFDAMPSFTPDGRQIVFTSDREAGGLDVWTITLAADGGSATVEQLARGGEKAALWPMIDASPSPRLFYEALLRAPAGPNQPRSEIRMVELEAKGRRGLSPGTRPRASPRADAVVFTRADPKTGKRDLYLMTDRDGAAFTGPPVNLTNTPDVDECDPSFSRTGGRIAYASDAATADGNRLQYDVYVLTLSDPTKPVRVTHNASLDDSPAWDPAGRNVYFRSNRGGKWGVWKAQVP